MRLFLCTVFLFLIMLDVASISRSISNIEARIGQNQPRP